MNIININLVIFCKKKSAKKFHLQAIHRFPNQRATLPYVLLEKKFFHGNDQKYLHLWCP